MAIGFGNSLFPASVSLMQKTVLAETCRLVVLLLLLPSSSPVQRRSCRFPSPCDRFGLAISRTHTILACCRIAIDKKLCPPTVHVMHVYMYCTVKRRVRRTVSIHSVLSPGEIYGPSPPHFVCISIKRPFSRADRWRSSHTTTPFVPGTGKGAR